jgi:hypothetical protein
MTNTINKTHIIGFSYQREEDGELCDFTGEIATNLDEDWIKTCDEELVQSRKTLPCGSQWEWDGTVDRVIQHSKEDNYYYGIYEEMENLTWDYTEKIVREVA